MAAADDQEIPASVQPARVDSDDDYDPTNLVTPEVASTSVTSNPAPAQNGTSKHTKGGFVIEDEDDDESEEDSGAPSNALNKPSDTAVANVNKTMQPTEDEINNSVSLNPPSISADSRALSITPLPNPKSPPLISQSEQQTSPISLPKVHLPKDRIGQLQDRINDDPRGDIDAYLELIREYRQKNRLDDARSMYQKVLKQFPSATVLWMEYARMELENEDLDKLEAIFRDGLVGNPSIPLWTMYVNYILRRNNLITDTTGNARTTVATVYNFVLEKLGIDMDSGALWKNYIDFLKSGPGTIGGTGWQDQQKVDSLRKVYRQAVSIPTAATKELWSAYHQFETGLNKQTAHRFMQDKTPAFLKASESYVQISRITRNIHRDVIPRLPPANGFEGDVEYKEQVAIFKEWLSWEMTDPLEIKDDDNAEYKKRIHYVHQQATMNLPYEPEFWYDAAEWCFSNGMETEANTFLSKGIDANPESCLLTFRKADRVESTAVTDENEDASKSRGASVREPYDKLLDALYALQQKTLDRQEKAIEKVDEAIMNRMPQSAIEKEENDGENEAQRKQLELERENQINQVKSSYQSQILLIRQTLSFAWIALLRAMRRVQGKAEARNVFIQARKKGHLTSDVYVASALMEHHCYRDPSAGKIFARGLILFPQDETFAVEYVKFLTEINDTTNARATFESVVNKLTAKPATVHKAKVLFYFMHSYESRYGELNQISKLETRMATLFPEDPQLSRFAHRYNSQQGDSAFNPTRARPLISMAVQARPKTIHTSIETSHHHRNTPSSTRATPQPSSFLSPRPAAAHLSMIDQHQPPFSPKRGFPDDLVTDRPAKVARGESPLKGAAGRRLDAKRRMEQQSSHSTTSQVQPLHPNIVFFLSILPKPHYFDVIKTRLPAAATVAMLQKIAKIGGDDGSNQNRGGTGAAYPAGQSYGYAPR